MTDAGQICKIYSHILIEYFLNYQSDKDNSMFCLKVSFTFYFCSQYLNTWTCKKEINEDVHNLFLQFQAIPILNGAIKEQTFVNGKGQ